MLRRPASVSSSLPFAISLVGAVSQVDSRPALPRRERDGALSQPFLWVLLLVSSGRKRPGSGGALPGWGIPALLSVRPRPRTSGRSTSAHGVAWRCTIGDDDSQPAAVLRGHRGGGTVFVSLMNARLNTLWKVGICASAASLLDYGNYRRCEAPCRRKGSVNGAVEPPGRQGARMHPLSVFSVGRKTDGHKIKNFSLYTAAAQPKQPASHIWNSMIIDPISYHEIVRHALHHPMITVNRQGNKYPIKTTQPCDSAENPRTIATAIVAVPP